MQPRRSGGRGEQTRRNPGLFSAQRLYGCSCLPATMPIMRIAMLRSHTPSKFEAFIPKSIVCLREGYGRQFFLNDLLAGVTVGVIALPLAIAFAIASHVRPEAGLYTAIVAGFLISLLGGS